MTNLNPAEHSTVVRVWEIFSSYFLFGTFLSLFTPCWNHFRNWTIFSNTDIGLVFWLFTTDRAKGILRQRPLLGPVYNHRSPVTPDGSLTASLQPPLPTALILFGHPSSESQVSWSDSHPPTTHLFAPPWLWAFSSHPPPPPPPFIFFP